MRYNVDISDTNFEVMIEPGEIHLDGQSIEVSEEVIVGTDLHSFLIGRESYRILANREEAGQWNLQLRGRRYCVDVRDEHAQGIRKILGGSSVGRTPQPVRAPMPGLIVTVEVSEGDLVESGRSLVIVEAMKMENEVIAEMEGRVGAIHVISGQVVEKDEILMDLLPMKDGWRKL